MYWVFTEQALVAALDQWGERMLREGMTQEAVATFAGNLHEFLKSREAKHHKLQGGASYEPEEAA